MAQRWAVVRLLDAGMHYAEISRRTGASTATDHADRILAQPRRGRLPRHARALQGRRRLDPLPARHRAMRERLRLAIPNKGRLLESTLALLHDAGLVFEEHDRSLVARVQNHPLDILFVRTGDVIEFVNDGVADAGDHGRRHPRRERRRPAGPAPARLRPLPSRRRGAGRLARTSRSRTSPACAIATSHPNVTRRFFADQGIPVEVISLSGAVEVAPRLGLADAIVDLVSTGSTLAMNGLRAIGDILASEAILLTNPQATVQRAGRARRHRHDARLRHRGPRPQVPDDERAGGQARRARGPAARARVAVRDPARPRRDDRDPLRRRRGRGLGAPAHASRAPGASGILVLPIEKILP